MIYIFFCYNMLSQIFIQFAKVYRSKTYYSLCVFVWICDVLSCQNDWVNCSEIWYTTLYFLSWNSVPSAEKPRVKPLVFIWLIFSKYTYWLMLILSARGDVQKPLRHCRDAVHHCDSNCHSNDLKRPKRSGTNNLDTLDDTTKTLTCASYYNSWPKEAVRISHILKNYQCKNNIMQLFPFIFIILAPVSNLCLKPPQMWKCCCLFRARPWAGLSSCQICRGYITSGRWSANVSLTCSPQTLDKGFATPIILLVST